MLNSLPVRSVRLRSTCSEDAQEDVGRLASSCVVMMGPPPRNCPSSFSCGLSPCWASYLIDRAKAPFSQSPLARRPPGMGLPHILPRRLTRVLSLHDQTVITAALQRRAGTVDGSDGGATLPTSHQPFLPNNAGTLLECYNPERLLSDSCPTGRQHSAQRCPASDSCRSCLARSFEEYLKAMSL